MKAAAPLSMAPALCPLSPPPHSHLDNILANERYNVPHLVHTEPAVIMEDGQLNVEGHLHLWWRAAGQQADTALQAHSVTRRAKTNNVGTPLVIELDLVALHILLFHAAQQEPMLHWIRLHSANLHEYGHSYVAWAWGGGRSGSVLETVRMAVGMSSRWGVASMLVTKAPTLQMLTMESMASTIRLRRRNTSISVTRAKGSR